MLCEYRKQCLRFDDAGFMIDTGPQTLEQALATLASENSF